MSIPPKRRPNVPSTNIVKKANTLSTRKYRLKQNHKPSCSYKTTKAYTTELSGVKDRTKSKGSASFPTKDGFSNGNTSSQASQSQSTEEENQKLEEEAIRQILLETRRAKERVDTIGAAGWSRKPIPRVNQHFARRIVGNTLAANEYMKKH